MRLGDWIAAQGLNFTTCGVRLGIDRPDTVRRYCLPDSHKDRRIPRPDIMRRIWCETRGAVAPNDFYDLPELSGTAAEPQAADVGPGAAGVSSQGPAAPALAADNLAQGEAA